MRIERRLSLVFLLAALSTGLVVVSGIRAGDNVWTGTGPFGISVTRLTVHPDSSQRLFASTPDGDTNIYKTEDGGGAWTAANSGIPAGTRTWDVVVDPNDTGTLYVATDTHGVYKSEDGGDNWALRNGSGISDTAIISQAWSIAISPLGDALYAGGSKGVFRSEDGAETWEKLGNGAPTGWVRALAVAPSMTQTVYAGTYGEQGAFRSNDGGDTWQPASGGFGVYPNIWDLAVDPTDSQVVYMACHFDTVYKTLDGGQSWQPVGVGLESDYVNAIAIDADHPQVLYAGAGPNGTPGVYQSKNGGGVWTPMMEGLGGQTVMSLALDGADPQSLYAGTYSGVWKYTILGGPTDYQLTINEGALFTNRTGVTLTLTATTGTTEMMISNDGGFAGATWEPFVSQKPWTITSYGSYVIPRVVYAKFLTYGEISAVYQDDIILDVTAPEGTLEVIDPIPVAAIPGSEVAATAEMSHTVYLPNIAQGYLPGSRHVILSLSATDDVSGVSDMQVSNDPQMAGALWEAYVTEKDWVMPDGGTVYVRYRDRAGNESVVYSDTLGP
jgi:photosystem II stability/assembly factor-like uncharacterized protein